MREGQYEKREGGGAFLGLVHDISKVDESSIRGVFGGDGLLDSSGSIWKLRHFGEVALSKWLKKNSGLSCQGICRNASNLGELFGVTDIV